MKQIVLTMILGVGLLTPSILAQHNSYVTGFDIMPTDTPPGKATRCTVALNQKQMEAVLKNVGWHQGHPIIDWNIECVVIISPAKSYSKHRLSFFNLTWTGKEFALRWGWRRIQPVRGSSALSVGFENLSTSETLIIGIKRYVFTANKLRCYEYDPK